MYVCVCGGGGGGGGSLSACVIVCAYVCMFVSKGRCTLLYVTLCDQRVGNQAQWHHERTDATRGNTKTHSKAVGHDRYTLFEQSSGSRSIHTIRAKQWVTIDTHY